MPEKDETEKRPGREKLYFDNGRIIACTDYAAKFFDVTAATLANWAAAGCPKFTYGYWDIGAVVAYQRELEGVRAAQQAERDPTGMSLSNQKLDAERQLKEANLERIRLQNDVARGEYLKRADVVANLTELLAVVKASLQGLSSELMREVARHVEPEEERKLAAQIHDTMSDALRQMSVEGVYHARS